MRDIIAVSNKKKENTAIRKSNDSNIKPSINHDVLS